MQNVQHADKPPHQKINPFSAVVRILVVEDCQSDVFLIRKMLRKLNANARCLFTDVPRLTDAFARIQQEKFDLILLDLNLLDMDGVVSIAVLHAEVPNTPIVIYSGMADSKFKEKALSHGAAAYLVKGEESPESVERVINHVLLQKHVADMYANNIPLVPTLDLISHGV